MKKKTKGILNQQLSTIRLAFNFFALPAIISAGCIGTDVMEPLDTKGQIKITSPIMEMEVGQSAQFTYQYFNEHGVMEQLAATWSSSNPSVLDISEGGSATALALGSADVTVSFEQLVDMRTILVSDQAVTRTTRTANLTGSGNYQVSGTAVLDRSGTPMVVEFANDFMADSGPGLYVYLSNAPNSVNGGVELGELQASSGEQTYSVPADIALFTYDYVLVYCKPFGVVFGYGQFD